MTTLYIGSYQLHLQSAVEPHFGESDSDLESVSFAVSKLNRPSASLKVTETKNFNSMG